MGKDFNEETTSPSSNTNEYIVKTKKWIEQFVIHLNLCPFAQHPFKSETIRFVVTEDNDLQRLAQYLIKELYFLKKTENKQVETTLIIHPNALNNFYDYCDFLQIVDQILEDFDFGGAIQVASFHPGYQFENTNKSDVENFTNRSPFPMLHLLREESVSWAVKQHPNTDLIPQNNIRLLQKMGLEKVKDLLTKINEG